MFHQNWENRVPTTLFEQTQYEMDQLFFATFPAAREAACNAGFERSIYGPTSPVGYPTFHEATQPLGYGIRNDPDIGSTSVSFRGRTQELPYPQLHFDYFEGLHPQRPFLSHHQTQPSYYCPPRPIENVAPVYIPSEPLYHHQHSSEPPFQHFPRSHPSPVPSREQTHLVHQPSNISPQVSTSTQETVSDGHLETPSNSFRQLNRHMKPPTLKFPNNCQLGVMRLDRLSDPSDLESPQLSSQPHPSPSVTSPAPPSPSTPPPTEFLLNSAPSPSIGLSSLPPSKSTPEKKPPLACLFCRGRKIACGAPLPGIKKTCNQCRKRGLTCYYPTESRRGMRKKKPPSDDPEGDAKTGTKTKKRKKN